MVKVRSLIYIESDDFEIYQKIIKETEYFKNNIDLFTCAALVGRFIINKSLPISKRKDYIRLDMRTVNQNFDILKCLAISEDNNVNILNDEEKLYSYCENYANAGIKEIYKWYSDKNYDFETKISEILLEFWEKIDLNHLN